MNSSLQNFYDRAPVLVQHGMTTVKGVLNDRNRYGTEYQAHRRWLEAFDDLPYERKLQHQQNALADFVMHAYRHSQFYRELLDGVGVRPESIRTAQDLKRLPTVGKEDLRSNMARVRTHVSGDRLTESHTGGTTGKSLVVTVTLTDLQRRMATLDHFKARVGFENRKMRRASFTGKHMVPPAQSGPPFSRRNAAANQLLFSAFHLNERTVADYFDELNRFRPAAIDGFPTGMLGVAKYMLRNELQLDSRPVAIFPTAEGLLGDDREILETAFGARVYNQYASSEGAPFITECSAGQLHVEMSTGVFEHTDDNHILVTSFLTHGTPLIRYDIRDRAVPSSEPACYCGNNTQMIKEITGRDTQFLYRSDGGKVSSVNLSNMFKNIPNSIIEAQVRQEIVGQVEIMLVADRKVHRPEHDEILRDEFRHKFDPQTTVEISHVASIPVESSGKRPFVINLVSDTGSM